MRNPPLHIDSVRVPGIDGMIGLTSCPGARDEFIFDLYGEILGDDLQVIRSWGASVVVTLLDDFELHSLCGREKFRQQVEAHNMIWLHMPVTNRGTPDERFDKQWTAAAPSLCSLLRKGKRIVIHCKEGIGRAGLIATRLLVELGVPVEEAMRIIKKARPGSLMMYSQEKCCYEFASGGGREREGRAQNL